MNKFNKTYNKIKIELNTAKGIDKLSFSKRNLESSFIKLYKDLINENYNIFPVPIKLLDDMVNFIVNNNEESKEYKLKDIKNNFINDWKYYKEFNENINLMLKENFECSITLVKYNEQNIKEILNKFKCYLTYEELKNSRCSIKSYDDKFNCFLFVKTYKYSLFLKDKIRKSIQHELIHWQQIILNSHTNKTYGKFNDKKFNLTNEQIEFLKEACNYNFQNYDLDYLSQGVEFEPWCANTVEEFENSKLSLNEFEKIIKDEKLFFKYMISNNITSDIYEMLLFSELCYLSSINDKFDNRYYYLIEAIKENKII